MRETSGFISFVNKGLMENEELYKGLMLSMPVAMYTTDRDGVITFFNQRAVELWGRKPLLHDLSEKRYCGSWKLYRSDGTFLPHEECPMAKALKGEKSTKAEEICIERPDGSRIFALANINLIHNRLGEVIGAVNVLNDITDRKKMERDAQWLAAIVESSDDAIVSKNLQGVITSWNKGAQNIFGYTPQEVVGKPITILIPENREKEEDEILSKIRKGEKVEHFETVRVTKKGKKIHVSLTVSPIKNSKNVVIGASKIARDITRQVKTKKQLERYNRQLKQLNRVKDDFIGVASHELKTPLTIIKAHLQLMELEITDEEMKGLIDKTLQHTDKLNNLVSHLLDVSRIKEGKLSLELSEFDLNALIEECIASINLTERSYAFVREGYCEDLYIRADRQRVEQVIFNLLTNAIKYSRGKGHVVVKVAKEKNYVLLSVTDFGIGIPVEQTDKIFTRFFRVNGYGNKFSGLGIGLYISKEIIERHKGEIWVVSALGKGSTFSFKIPLQA